MPKIITPENFKCSLTRQLLCKPLKIADGNIYERDAIDLWFETHDTSPANVILPDKYYEHAVPAYFIEEQIENFLKEHQICIFDDFCDAIMTDNIKFEELNYLDTYLNKLGWKFINVSDYKIAPLHFAAFNGDVKLMRRLLNEGADPNVKDLEGFTPLVCAIAPGIYPIEPINGDDNNRIDAIKLLLEKGVDIEADQGDGWKPLHFAIKERYQEAIRILIDAGADINCVTDDGKTIEKMAKEYGCEELVSAMLTACNLLAVGRIVLNDSAGYFSFLPKDIKYKILEWLDHKNCLVLEQRIKVFDYAADKRKLAGTKEKFLGQTIFFKRARKSAEEAKEINESTSQEKHILQKFNQNQKPKSAPT